MNFVFISKLRYVVTCNKVHCFQNEFFRNLSKVNSTFKYSDLTIKLCNPKDKKSKPDENSLVFGKTFSDHMFEVEWTEDLGWGKPVISPLHDLVLHPAAKVLHYAQEVIIAIELPSSHFRYVVIVFL
ncbi:hypothetical protein AVEN_35744-1 [Araneus ventricosus]|uniref:Uncharacterized protein n=1 Tax=Araneus ventricosus TaxID=182803 RepID=A0A4Y2FIU5_ARAVE|nr:hypothetical protein AVEN_35744-1 [Araneus ventricosus]